MLPLPSPPPQAGIELPYMWDVYCQTWLPFGGLLTDMEAVGMAVDRAHLAAAQRQAEADQAQAQERFRCVACVVCGGGCKSTAWRPLCMNPLGAAAGSAFLLPLPSLLPPPLHAPAPPHAAPAAPAGAGPAAGCRTLCT